MASDAETGEAREGVDEEAAGGLIATSTTIAAIRAEWLALHAACGAPGPFQRPEWHETWLRHFGDDVEPVFLEFRDGERLAGVASLDLAGGLARELGDANVRDYAGPLAAPGYEGRVAETLLEWLAEDFTTHLELWGLQEASPMREALTVAAAAHGWAFAEEKEAVAPAMALPGDWETYLSALGKHDRHELRRKMRRLEESGPVEYGAVSDASLLGPELEELFTMMRASHEGKGAFLTSAMEAFFRDLATTFAGAGLVRLGSLRLDKERVAMLFTFEDDHCTYLYNSGYDPAFGPLAAGLLSKAYAIRDAIEHGQTRFDCLRGEEEYKRRLGGGAQRLFRARLTRR